MSFIKPYSFFAFIVSLLLSVASMAMKNEDDPTSNKLIKSTSTEKFNTKNESFNENYSTLSHHQASFNKNIIDGLAESVCRWFPNTSTENPIKILDLCCGHGKPTYDLLNKLTEKGVHVSKIVGYDISAKQIEQASQNYKNEKKLSFCIQNAETITDENEYDLIISLFGFHWMEDIDKTATAVSKALSSNGKVMFFVPLEKMDLFKFRNDFLSKSKWSEFFKEYTLHPFAHKKDHYINAFDKYFENEDKSTQNGEKTILYTEEEFINFLSSWMQELRHLNSQNIQCSGYVKDLLKSIPLNHDGNVRKREDGSILFTEHFFSYQGSLRDKKD